MLQRPICCAAGGFTVIRNGVDLGMAIPESKATESSSEVRARLGIPITVPLIGFVGRLADQKDPLRWIAVAEQLASTDASSHFVIIGDGDLRPQVEAATAHHGVRVEEIEASTY